MVEGPVMKKKSLEQLIDEQLRLPPIVPVLREELRRIPGVTGVGLGCRYRGGRRVDEVAVRVYVTHKRPLHEVPTEERLPREASGVPIDVMETQECRSSAQYEGHFPADNMPGGVMISVDRDKPGGGYIRNDGTLGCFVRLTAPPHTILGLTNSHVIFPTHTAGCTENGLIVGQPSWKGSRCCKTGVIGRALRGCMDAQVDAATIELNDRRRPQQKIPGLGPDQDGNYTDLIVGVAPAFEAPSGAEGCGGVGGIDTTVLCFEPVRKVGHATQKTGGTVDAFGVEAPLSGRIWLNQIVVKVAPGQGKFQNDGIREDFVRTGDSGSVLVNRFNRVVGLIHGQGGTRPGDGPGIGNYGVATQIHPVLLLMQVEIPPSPGVNLSETSSGAHEVGALVAGGGIEGHEWTEAEHARARVVAEISDELKSHPFGASLVELFQRHEPEIGGLIAKNRTMQVAWHRSGGPGFLARLLDGLESIDHPIPKETPVMTTEAALARLAAVLEEKGSPELKAAVADLHPIVVEVLGASRTIRDALDRIRAAGVARAAR
jgi:hypothetical protein